MIRHLLSVAVGLCLLTPEVRAQEPAPAEVISHIQASRSIAGMVRALSFDGCPQTDARGRQMFEEVARASLPTTALAELSLLWRSAYMECAYAPLGHWFEEALGQLLASNDLGSATSFVWQLPKDISNSMREALLDAVDRGVGGSTGMLFASKAIQGGSASERIGRMIAAIGSRSVTEEWIYSESGPLLKEQPTEYLRALADATSAMSDDRLRMALGFVTLNLSTGQITDDTPGLEALRERVSGREGIDAQVRTLRRPN